MIECNTQIKTMEDIIGNQTKEPKPGGDVLLKIKNKSESKPNLKGKPVSGRVWKSERSRCSSVIKSKGLKKSLEAKLKLREELKRVKEASRMIIEAKKLEKEQKKERRRENLKRQEENQKKSEIVQVIKNPAKIKKMKKKQLRQIQKRDTTNM